MGQALVGAETVCVVYLTIYALYRMLMANFRSYSPEPPTTVDYLFKISRVTGESEFSIFTKSAEYWPVSQAMIERDFKHYLSHQVVPHYVQDFIRRNRRHINDLRMPIF